MQAAGDHPGMLALNSRANCMVALMVYPLLAFAFVFAVRRTDANYFLSHNQYLCSMYPPLCSLVGRF